MTVAVVTEPSSLVAVHDQMAMIEAWVDQCDSIAELRDMSNKCAAITEYLERTSIEGRNVVAATMRRIEVRIGKLLPREQGNRTDLLPNRDEEVTVTSQQRAEFRKMAENEDVVEDVIANSTDTEPASRRKVIRKIRGEEPTRPRERSWTRTTGADKRVGQIIRSLSVIAESLKDFDADGYLATEEEVEGLDLAIKTLRQFRKSLVIEK